MVSRLDVVHKVRFLDFLHIDSTVLRWQEAASEVSVFATPHVRTTSTSMRALDTPGCAQMSEIYYRILASAALPGRMASNGIPVACSTAELTRQGYSDLGIAASRGSFLRALMQVSSRLSSSDGPNAALALIVGISSQPDYA